MARSLSSASTQHLRYDGTPPVSDTPHAFACWCYPTDGTNTQTLVGLFDKDSGLNYTRIALHQSKVICQQVKTNGVMAQTSVNYTTNEWHLIVGNVIAYNECSVFYDGGNKVTNLPAASANAYAFDRIGIGYAVDSTPNTPYSGRIAHCAIWNRILTDAEVANLWSGGHGVSPLMIAPEALVWYAPLINGDGDREWIAKRHPVPINSPTYAHHVPIVMPGGVRSVMKAVQSSSITVAVGLALETSTAQAITAAKRFPVGQASEADTAQAIAAAFNITFVQQTAEGEALVDYGTTQIATVVSVGQATEADAALAVVASRTVAAGLASETDAAQAIDSRRELAVGLASEADTAFEFGTVQTISVGLASESDSGLSVQAVRRVAAGLAVETDSATAFSTHKSVAVGLASESNTAFAFVGLQTIPVGLASEADSGLSVQAARRVAAGLAVETNSATAFATHKSVAVGMASESDTAFAFGTVQTITVGQSIETDSATAFSTHKSVAVGLASESGTALPLAGQQVITVGLAVESDSALSITATVTSIVAAHIVGLEYEAANVIARLEYDSSLVVVSPEYEADRVVQPLEYVLG